MTWVKICGITNLEDARVAVDCGADAIGFVFYERSPRYIDPVLVREIIRDLDSDIETVGLFVDPTKEMMAGIAETSGLKAVQVHRADLLEGTGKRNPEGAFLGNHHIDGLKTYLVLAARGAFWQEGGAHLPFGVFLDSGTVEQPGGTGKTFNWAEAAPLVQKMSHDVKVVVAGGLTPANVAEAIQVLHPWGVDVSSGVEVKPGKKDPAKVAAFVQAVRKAG